MNMTQISSNITLILKIFIPTFWIAFFGAFTLAIILTDYPYYGAIPGDTLVVGTVLFYVVGIAMFYFTLMKLKRVEMDGSTVYVTNYFKHLKYPIENIQQMTERDFFIFKLVIITWRKKGTFGKKTTFIASRNRYEYYLQQHPDVTAYLAKMEAENNV